MKCVIVNSLLINLEGNNILYLAHVVTGSLLIFIVFVFLYLRLRQNKKHADEIEIKNRQIEKKNIELSHLLKEQEVIINERTEKLYQKIKDYKKLHTELTESKDFLSAVINSLKQPFFIKDDSHKQVMLNDAALEQINMKREDIIGKSDVEIFSKKEAERFIKGDKIVLEKGTYENEEEVIKDGKLTNLITSKYLYQSPEGNKYIVGNVFDITQRRGVERMFKEIFNLNPALMCITKLNTGEFIDINKSFLGLLGYDKKECLGETSIGLAILGKSERGSLLSEFMQNKSFHHKKWSIITKNGEIKHCLFSAVLIDYVGEKAALIAGIDITEKEEAQYIIQESEQRFRSMFDNHTAIMYVVEPTSLKIIDFNKAALEFYGFSREEMSDKYLYDINNLSIKELKKLLLDARINTIKGKELKHTTANGEVKDVEVNATFISLNNSEVYFSIVTDITEKKAYERALAKSEEKYRKLTNQINDLLWAVDLNLNTYYISPSIEKLLGYTEEEYLKLDLKDVFSKGAFNEVIQLFESGVEAIKNYKPDDGYTKLINVELIHKTGKIVIGELHAGPVFDDAGNLIGVQGLIRDVTEKVKAERELQETNRRIETLIGNLPGIVYRCAYNKNYTMVFLSEEFDEIFGYDRAEVIDDRIYSYEELIVPEDIDHVHKLVQKAVSENESFELNYRIKTKSGEIKWLREKGRAVYDTEGIPIALEGFIVDDSAQKKIEDQLRQSQKMQAIGTLAGGIAHDFNNILFGILNYTEIIISETEKGNPVQKYAKEILKSGHRATDLISQILLFSRKTDQELKKVQIHLIIKESIKFLSSTSPAYIDIKAEIEDVGYVRGDPVQLQQVFFNLASNAIYAMKSKGLLEVSLYKANDNGCNYVCLSIKDTGAGMDTETQSRIFEPFYTTKPVGEGTGLGLSTVHGIVKSYSGFIKVFSELNKGSIFEVYLPCIEN